MWGPGRRARRQVEREANKPSSPVARPQERATIALREGTHPSGRHVSDIDFLYVAVGAAEMGGGRCSERLGGSDGQVACLLCSVAELGAEWAAANADRSLRTQQATRRRRSALDRWNCSQLSADVFLWRPCP